MLRVQGEKCLHHFRGRGGGEAHTREDLQSFAQVACSCHAFRLQFQGKIISSVCHAWPAYQFVVCEGSPEAHPISEQKLSASPRHSSLFGMKGGTFMPSEEQTGERVKQCSESPQFMNCKSFRRCLMYVCEKRLTALRKLRQDTWWDS